MREWIHKWIAVVSLMLAAFIFNTSEFIPVGLLSDIGADFHADEAKMGMIISVYAWVVALASLPLMVLTSGVKYKHLMLALIAFFAVFQGLSALAPNYGSLMAARIGVACCHAIFWGVVPLMAVKAAPEGKDAAALSIVVSGGSVAMIVGMPLGRMIGLAISWRATFALLAVIALVIFAVIAAKVPVSEQSKRFPIKQLPSLFRHKLLIRIYVYTILVVTAYFTAYAYVEPYLDQIGHFAPQLITATLMLLGFSGLAGSFVFAKLFPRIPRQLFVASGLMMIIAMITLYLGAAWIAPLMLACMMLALNMTIFNLINQEMIVNRTPAEGSTVAMATYSGLFNLGIGSGTYAGGLVITWSALSQVGLWGSIFGTIALAYGIVALLPEIRRNNASNHAS